ncbi:hypothetical protein ACFSDD_10855 [Salipiger marinus]|nr:hypothetical protein [Salipiger manganoxidans]MEB3420227.1 hypothetical protein [Salipiger manganoxidans]
MAYKQCGPRFAAGLRADSAEGQVMGDLIAALTGFLAIVYFVIGLAAGLS